MQAQRLPLLDSFGRFAAIGIVGFLIDAGVLSALVLGAGWQALPARLVSITLAITTTWLINRRVTFASRTVPFHVEYAGYFLIQLAGVCLNVGVFLAILRMWPQLARMPVVAQAAGSVTALFFNFFVTRKTLYSTREVQ